MMPPSSPTASDYSGALAQARDAYGEITLVISPPRAASTALARVLWNHPTVDFYCHEPFERRYFGTDSDDPVGDALDAPLALADVLPRKRSVARRDGGILVKEISFQVGAAFEELAALTERPVIFLMRHPALTVSSRMAVIEHYRGQPAFAARESGWVDFAVQVTRCQRSDIPYVLVDATDLRARPVPTLSELFDRLGLSFAEDHVRWTPVAGLDLAGLRGPDDRFFTRVLGSSGIEPPDERVPPLSAFPTDGGLREHVAEATALYEALLEDDGRVGAA